MVSKLSEIWLGLFITDPDLSDPDPDYLLIPGPESRGQKGTGSRIRNTGLINLILYLSQHSASGSAGRLVIAVHFHLQSLFSGGICNVGRMLIHTQVCRMYSYATARCKFLKNKRKLPQQTMTRSVSNMQIISTRSKSNTDKYWGTWNIGKKMWGLVASAPDPDP